MIVNIESKELQYQLLSKYESIRFRWVVVSRRNRARQIALATLPDADAEALAVQQDAQRRINQTLRLESEVRRRGRRPIVTRYQRMQIGVRYLRAEKILATSNAIDRIKRRSTPPASKLPWREEWEVWDEKMRKTKGETEQERGLRIAARQAFWAADAPLRLKEVRRDYIEVRRKHWASAAGGRILIRPNGSLSYVDDLDSEGSVGFAHEPLRRPKGFREELARELAAKFSKFFGLRISHRMVKECVTLVKKQSAVFFRRKKD